jgi:hypothetical protein
MPRKRHLPFDVAAATAETLAHRLPVFWKGIMAPTPAGNKAIAEMIVEKQLAFAEGVMAVQAEFLRQSFRPWWLWTSKQSQDAAKVKASARRLRKRV